MGEAVALHITVVVFAGPNESSLGFDHVGNHIIDKSVLIPDLLSLKLGLVLFFVDSLESVLECAVVLLENGVFGSKVKRVLAAEGELKAAMSKLFNALISVVHTKANSSFSFKFEDFHSLLSAVFSSEDDFKCTWLINCEISGLVLISVGVSADDDWLLPSGNESGNVLDDDWFSKDCSIEDVPDGAIGALPHLLEVELFDSRLIRSDGGALDADFALLDGLCSFNSDLVLSFISVLDAEVEVEDVEVEEGEDEMVLDGLPDDSGHFVSVELSHWFSHLDFLDLHKI